MIEAVLSNVVVLALLGVVCKQFSGRLSRLEGKVDQLIQLNGAKHEPKRKKKRGEKDE